MKESRTEIGSNNNSSESCNVTSGSQAYDEKLNNGFKDLIAQLKNKQKGIKRKAENDLISTNDDSAVNHSSGTDPSQTVPSSASEGENCTGNNIPSSLLSGFSPM